MLTKDGAPSIGVLDVDGLHLPGGAVAPVTGRIGHVGHLYAGARRHGLAQLWLTDAWVRAAGLPASIDVEGPGLEPGAFRELRHAFVDDGLAGLYAFPAGLAPWVDVRRQGEAGAGLSVVFPSYDAHAVWWFDQGERAAGGAELLAGLLAYAAAVGVAYYRSPGRTGLDLVEVLGKRGAGSRRVCAETWPGPAMQAETVTEMSWVRPLTPDEQGRAWLHSYDKNAQWLSAAGVVELGLAGIEERGGHGDPGGVVFDRKLPGYWLAALDGGDERWRCTPTLTLALERGQAVAISRAHVWTEHSRALESWYERLRAARTTLQADATPAGALALGALKLTYALTVSSFNGAWLRDKGSPLYRPDWRHAVISQANANMERALHKMEVAGYRPVAVHKDAVYLVSDEPDPVAACPPSITLGAGLGHFKVQDTVPLGAVRPVLDGTRGGGIGALIKAIRAAVEAESG